MVEDSKSHTHVAPKVEESKSSHAHVAPKVSLAPAAESHDPVVHQLLAQRQAAQSNLDDATPDDAVKARADEARKQVDAVDKQLADLGFSGA